MVIKILISNKQEIREKKILEKGEGYKSSDRSTGIIITDVDSGVNNLIVNTNTLFVEVSLDELNEYLEENIYLPRLEKEKYTGQYKVEKKNQLLLEKIEEAHIYFVELKKQKDKLKQLVCSDHPYAEAYN